MLTQPTVQRIELWPIERLVEYPRNPRKNDAAVDRMCASIQEFGFAIPVLARSSGEVIDGHLRAKAARKMGSWPGGDTTRIPVIPCDGWTDAQVKAFRLMVNRSVTWAEWDEDKLDKSDRIDARKLAELLRAGLLSAVLPWRNGTPSAEGAEPQLPGDQQGSGAHHEPDQSTVPKLERPLRGRLGLRTAPSTGMVEQDHGTRRWPPGRVVLSATGWAAEVAPGSTARSIGGEPQAWRAPRGKKFVSRPYPTSIRNDHGKRTCR
jgi:hypothetical protein